MDLFGQHLLDAETHTAVFGALPSSLSRDLRTPEVGDLILQLLDAGWRRGQLAARIGAMQVAPDPAAGVTALLRGFLDQLPPDARWREERTERAVTASRSEVEQPASPESREHWVRQIRSELAHPRPPRQVTQLRQRPACASCGAESSFFVTREVRLCEGCVALLSTGAVQLANPDQIAG